MFLVVFGLYLDPFLESGWALRPASRRVSLEVNGTLESISAARSRCDAYKNIGNNRRAFIQRANEMSTCE